MKNNVLVLILLGHQPQPLMPIITKNLFCWPSLLRYLNFANPMEKCKSSYKQVHPPYHIMSFVPTVLENPVFLVLLLCDTQKLLNSTKNKSNYIS